MWSIGGLHWGNHQTDLWKKSFSDQAAGPSLPLKLVHPKPKKSPRTPKNIAIGTTDPGY